MTSRGLKTACLVGLLLWTALSPHSLAEGSTTNPFPVPPAVTPAVRFWLDIYTRYPLTAGVLHDSRLHAIVYEVIDLVHPDAHRAWTTNEKRIKAAKARYRTILRQLARKRDATHPEALRVAALFSPEAGAADFLDAAARIRCQVGQKDRFQEGLIRSGAVIEEIRDTFRRRHLPVDLAFLPHVESSFHNGAYSKYGAVGIWQFTRATGKRLMTVDDTVDMRLDPIFATRAAAALLEENYRKLGTWPLAITAYNHGVRGVLRAKRRHGDYEGIFSRYRTRRFRFASRNFYPEFLAAREAAGRFRAYFGDIVLNRTEPARITRIPGYALFSDIAGHFQIAPERLSALNPALRPVVVRGSKLVPKGYPLRLPFNEWQTFSSFHAGFPIDNCAEKQLQSAVYRVRSGDTLTAIARVNGIRLSDLISANGLDPGKPLRVNQRLTIPSTFSGRRAQRRVPPAPADIAAAPGLPSPPLPPRPAVKCSTIRLSEASVTPRDVQSMSKFHDLQRYMGKPAGILIVEAEETLGHYADWAGVGTASLRRINRFSFKRTLRLGESVVIPLDRVKRETFETRRRRYHQSIQDAFFSVHRIESAVVYRVKPGETIWTLSSRVFNLPAWLIQKYNPDVDFGDLRRSQQLLIPVVDQPA